MVNKRIATGIPGLDVILQGGIMANRSYLLVGSAGTGKTIFATQWLIEGVRSKEKCMYISVSEPTNNIIANVASFGWDLNAINLVDLSQYNLPLLNTIEEYQVFAPNEVEDFGIWEKIYQEVKDNPPDRLVIDSATQLRYLSIDAFQFRKHMNGLVKILNSLNITSILLYEPLELVKEAAAALAVDGIFNLQMEISINRAIGIRTFQVTKFRGSDFISGYHIFKINENGLHIFPHIVEKTGEHIPGKKIVKFGIPQLDELLKGGLESGTTTIISGPSGVGKSTLATQLLINSCNKKSKGILFAFEESIDSILQRSLGLGMALTEKLQNKKVSIIRINPMEITPDQFLENLRYVVEEENIEFIVIDSLRGYQLAMEEYGTMLAHLQNIVTYLNRNNVTTILINEVAAITGSVKITELGISHLADNIIIIRYAELESSLIKIICCLKKRLGDFETELRQITMDNFGIHIGKKLDKLHGILTGIPNTIF